MNKKPNLFGRLFTILHYIKNRLELTTPDKMNIDFILSDNQSFYNIGSQVRFDIKIANIEKLADERAEFANFYTAPFYLPGRSIQQKNERVFPKSPKSNGYRSAIFGKWHLGYGYPYMPKNRGV